MKIINCVLMAAGLVAYTSTISVAQDFKNYPGAKRDDSAARRASARGVQSDVYTTSDGFEKVCTFYRSLYKEHPWPAPAPTLPSGQKVQWAFFILDGGKDLAHSKYWIKVQRPYILTIDETAEFKDVRDVTLIQTVRKK